MQISLVTVTWSNETDFDITKTVLHQSFKKFNPESQFFHFHFNRGHFWREEIEFGKMFGKESEYLLYKIKMLLSKVKDIETQYIIFSDANDVTCLGSTEVLPELYDLENYIIFGCEKNQWPKKEEKNLWPDYEDYKEHDTKNETFLNSGMILAKKEKFVELLESMISNTFTSEIKNFNNDQGAYTYYYNKGFKPEIKLDYSNIFALNTFQRSTDEFFRQDNRLVSKSSGVKPLFIHDNGWNHGSPKYTNFFGLKDLYSS